MFENVITQVQIKQYIFEGVQRHLADHLILARQEAEKEEDPEVLASLTETHITQTLADIFFGTCLTLCVFFLSHSTSAPDSTLHKEWYLSNQNVIYRGIRIKILNMGGLVI